MPESPRGAVTAMTIEPGAIFRRHVKRHGATAWQLVKPPMPRI
jgi:hypothetical protein